MDRRPQHREHAIATPHAAASRAGAEVLAAGGSAVDAALAAAAVLTVAYPHMCALGGDLFALVRTPDGRTRSVNASGPAAAGVDPARLRAGAAGGMPVHGPDTITVPGLVAGWGALHDLAGRQAWGALLQPAIALAAGGVAVAPGLGTAIGDWAQDGRDPGMRGVFAPGGAPLAAGDRLRQPALAQTLRTLAADGPGALYAGPLAETLVDGLRGLGSALGPGDLERYAPVVEAPLRGGFRDVEVLTSPPNASGVLLLQALAALDDLDLADPLGAGAGVLAALLQAGAAQRERELADPAAAPFDPQRWLGARRLAEIAAAAADGRGVPAAGARPDGDTVGIVAVDGDGGAVSIIQSVYHAFGAQVLEPSTGILMHNRGASFSLDPGHPNVLAPGKRPAHTLMPVMVERDGGLLGVLGTMGGKVQAQIHAQVLLRLLGGLPPQAAVDAPRWVVGALEAGEVDGTVRVESDVAAAASASLRELGLDVLDVGVAHEDTGHCQAIWCDGALQAGSDGRADGAAILGRR